MPSTLETPASFKLASLSAENPNSSVSGTASLIPLTPGVSEDFNTVILLRVGAISSVVSAAVNLSAFDRKSAVLTTENDPLFTPVATLSAISEAATVCI